MALLASILSWYVIKVHISWIIHLLSFVAKELALLGEYLVRLIEYLLHILGLKILATRFIELLSIQNS